jgi:hypothetical protein
VIRLIALYDCKKYGLPIAEWMEPNEDHAAGIRFNIDGLMHEEEVAKLRKDDFKFSKLKEGLGIEPIIETAQTNTGEMVGLNSLPEIPVESKPQPKWKNLLHKDTD